ncbi:hypothetical protein [Actinoplanes couchii]|uniref:Uncharacterized protein n=1 Tax=Actinoplanes couchii TaxID=403638 RepID=A0ABQ3XN78_9ACTN|nr:hypothetical protein [Actinoplanes couchii]MDR6318123.1 hypothetical protein [Actinoplanes couchii]GID59961.1 hypothetical protein Aco03nite_083650 [Actinoplanes couchii]
MTVFGCRTCGTALTVPVSEVVLPAHASQQSTNGPGSLAPALEPGTFAVDPLPSGPPFRKWAELDPGEAESLGWYAPRLRVSDGPAGRVLLAPGDVRDTTLDPARAGEYGCCGLSGSEPNMLCTGCGSLVASRVDDCGYPQAVWLDPSATQVIESGRGPHPLLDWADLVDQCPGIPPTEPDGGWHPVWTATVAVALAHLLAGSGGGPIRYPDRQVAEILRPVLDRLLVGGPAAPERTLVLAGPGLPPADGDLILVPVHPQTGQWWPAPASSSSSSRPIPLAWEAWRHLALDRVPKPALRSVPLLPDALPEQLPDRRLPPDGQIFLTTLARLPEVRQPWLHTIYERGRPGYYVYYSFKE